MSIAVIMPSNGTIQDKTVTCLTHLMHYHHYGSLRFYNPNSSVVHQARFMGANEAIADGCEQILFIDSDMTFPHDGLQRLLNAEKPICGVVYPKRNGQGMVGPLVDKDAGLVECNALGFGFILIQRIVFDVVDRPWFQNILNPDGDLKESEDVYFCNRAREKWDYRTYIHSELSYEVGHLGTREHRLT